MIVFAFGFGVYVSIVSATLRAACAFHVRGLIGAGVMIMEKRRLPRALPMMESGLAVHHAAVTEHPELEN